MSKLQKDLSPLEHEIMIIVWELKECSVRDVVKKLESQKKLAYTTVATLLQRLYEKGLVEKSSHELVSSYKPKVSKEIYGKNLVKSFIQRCLSTYGESAIVSFAESIDKLPKDKKEYLLQLLDKLNESK